MKFKSYDYPSDNSGFEKYRLLLKVHTSPLGFVQLIQNMEANYNSTGLNSIDKYLDNLKDECCRLNNFEQMNTFVDSYLIEKKRIKEIESIRLHEEYQLFIEKMKSQVNKLNFGPDYSGDYLWTMNPNSANIISDSNGSTSYSGLGYSRRLSSDDISSISGNTLTSMTTMSDPTSERVSREEVSPEEAVRRRNAGEIFLY